MKRIIILMLILFVAGCTTTEPEQEKVIPTDIVDVPLVEKSAEELCLETNKCFIDGQCTSCDVEICETDCSDICESDILWERDCVEGKCEKVKNTNCQDIRENVDIFTIRNVCRTNKCVLDQRAIAVAIDSLKKEPQDEAIKERIKILESKK